MDLNSIFGKQNFKEMWRRGKSIIHHQIKFLKNKLIYPMSYSSGIFNLETSTTVEFEFKFKLEFELEKKRK
jgi:hypothetical protein